MLFLDSDTMTSFLFLAPGDTVYRSNWTLGLTIWQWRAKVGKIEYFKLEDTLAKERNQCKRGHVMPTSGGKVLVSFDQIRRFESKLAYLVDLAEKWNLRMCDEDAEGNLIPGPAYADYLNLLLEDIDSLVDIPESDNSGSQSVEQTAWPNH